MKADAPEKIYLSDFTDTTESVFYVKQDNTKKTDIEYTRTDAFIKKVFEFFGEHLWEYIDVKNANCDTFINIDGNKLKEDFKNYMKGE